MKLGTALRFQPEAITTNLCNKLVPNTEGTLHVLSEPQGLILKINTRQESGSLIQIIGHSSSMSPHPEATMGVQFNKSKEGEESLHMLPLY